MQLAHFFSMFDVNTFRYCPVVANKVTVVILGFSMFIAIYAPDYGVKEVGRGKYMGGGGGLENNSEMVRAL